MPQDPALQNQIHYLQTQGSLSCLPQHRCDLLVTPTPRWAQKTDLRKAQHFIFMEYHAIEGIPSPGRALRIFLPSGPPPGGGARFFDDMGSIGFVDTAFAKKLQQQGIQCRVFNPIVPGAERLYEQPRPPQDHCH